jgi:abortive infection bacteriophage resistance protein
MSSLMTIVSILNVKHRSLSAWIAKRKFVENVCANQSRKMYRKSNKKIILLPRINAQEAGERHLGTTRRRRASGEWASGEVATLRGA